MWVFLPTLTGHPFVLCQAVHLSHLRGERGAGTHPVFSPHSDMRLLQPSSRALGYWSDKLSCTSEFDVIEVGAPGFSGSPPELASGQAISVLGKES